MTAPITPAGGWHAAAEAIMPFAAQVHAGWLPLIAVAGAGILRLLQEWQQRRTLSLIFQHAPGGSVIIVRKRGLDR